jgi:hypothetical protein
MKRQYKSIPTDVDFSKIVKVNDFTIDEDDCFTKMYDPSTNDCALCADCDLCSILFNKTVSVSLKKKFNDEFGQTADTYDFESVKSSKLGDKLSTNPGVYTRADMFDVVKKLSKCDCNDLVNDCVESILMEYGLKEHNGKIVLK